MTFLDLGRLPHGAAEQWDALAEGALVANPFAERLWAVPSAGLPDLARPRPRLVVVDGSEQRGSGRPSSSGWLAALPCVPARRWHTVPGPLLTTWRHDYSFLQSPLLSRAAPERAAAALAAALTRRPRTVVLEQLDDVSGSLLTDALTARGWSVRAWSRQQRPVLLPEDAAAGLDGLGRSRARTAKRQLRRLAEDLGGEPEVVDVSADPACFEQALELEASGWKGDGGSAMLARPGHADWARTVAASLRQAGRLRLLALRGGGRMAAFSWEVRTPDGGSFAVKVAQDSRLDDRSPGVLLEALGPRLVAAEPDWRWTDSCTEPGNALIEQLWSGRRDLVTLVAAPRPLARTVVALAHRLEAAR